jgi:succinyl-CoA synthetase beta subunit
MSQYGINVPPGIPVFRLDEVEPAAQKMKDAEGLVRQGPCFGGPFMA